MNAFLANKVGSGFDIAASIYGSQLYRRFSNTSILKDSLVPFLLNRQQLNAAANTNILTQENFFEFRKLFGEFVSGFDYKLRPVKSLSDKVDLCLIDVGSGSDTRLMVRKVLEWSQTTALE